MATHVVGIFEDLGGGHVWELGFLYHQSHVRDLLWLLKRIDASEAAMRDHDDNGMVASHLAALEGAAGDRVIAWSTPVDLRVQSSRSVTETETVRETTVACFPESELLLPLLGVQDVPTAVICGRGAFISPSHKIVLWTTTTALRSGMSATSQRWRPSDTARSSRSSTAATN